MTFQSNVPRERVILMFEMRTAGAPADADQRRPMASVASAKRTGRNLSILFVCCSLRPPARKLQIVVVYVAPRLPRRREDKKRQERVKIK